jgi:hypothetical protein
LLPLGARERLLRARNAPARLLMTLGREPKKGVGRVTSRIANSGRD